jgi:hypothetical protein
MVLLGLACEEKKNATRGEDETDSFYHSQAWNYVCKGAVRQCHPSRRRSVATIVAPNKEIAERWSASTTG